MRILALGILAFAAISAAVPAQAQTYDPHYPVCMKAYSGRHGGGEWIDCSYASIPQCRASASGRAAMCEINPYFAQAQLRPVGRYRRHYRAY